MERSKQKKAYNKKWPKRNLGELVNFLERINPDGISLKQIADVLDVTVQNVSQMFNKDDMKLSRVEKIVNAFGYNLVLFFPEREKIGLDYSINRNKNYPNAKNLSGLAKYISDSNISINYMSQRIGKANNVITNAFNKGDIFLSTLYLITNNLKINFIWEFRKINS